MARCCSAAGQNRFTRNVISHCHSSQSEESDDTSCAITTHPVMPYSVPGNYTFVLGVVLLRFCQGPNPAPE